MTENYPDYLFEIAEQRERENEKLTREILKQKLEVLKKENFQKVADACLKHYEKKYGELPSKDEYWRFLVADYCGTGEGRTICVLMTQANPYRDDFDEEHKQVPINSQEYRSVREFHKYFGTFMLNGIEFVSREDFFEKYKDFLPPKLINLKDQQCFLNYHSELHFNFS